MGLIGLIGIPGLGIGSKEVPLWGYLIIGS